jgi:hypothetical protein
LDSSKIAVTGKTWKVVTKACYKQVQWKFCDPIAPKLGEGVFMTLITAGECVTAMNV